jgi:quinol monooxygenase YgiN
MHTLTAIIRAQKGSEALVYNELLKVGAYARDYEPDTIGFFVAQDTEEPCVFTTYERFIDKTAMDRHNNGAGSKVFLLLRVIFSMEKLLSWWQKKYGSKATTAHLLLRRRLSPN